MFLDAVLVYNFLLDEPHERIRAVAVVKCFGGITAVNLPYQNEITI